MVNWTLRNWGWMLSPLIWGMCALPSGAEIVLDRSYDGEDGGELTSFETRDSFLDATYGVKYTKSSRTLEIGTKAGGTYWLSGKMTNGLHVVVQNTCTVYLNNLSIKVPNDSTSCKYPAFQLKNNCRPVVYVSGNCELSGGYQRGGLELDDDNAPTLHLIANSGAKLVCEGHDGGAGIGGNRGYRGGREIWISGSGTVVAKGGAAAAGIGGGRGANNVKVRITGSVTVQATGGALVSDVGAGAGIGGGSGGSGGEIVISNGTVVATASRTGAGIGGGRNGGAGIISICGGNVTATGGAWAAGIGGGGAASSSKTSGSISISGGVINAYGRGGAGIGGGNRQASPTITISGGEVYASGMVYEHQCGAGIGSGPENSTTAGNSGVITFTGGLTRAYAKSQAAAIGGGSYSDWPKVWIKDGTVEADTDDANAVKDVGAGYNASSDTGSFVIDGGSFLYAHKRPKSPKNSAGETLYARKCYLTTELAALGKLAIKGINQSYVGNELYPVNNEVWIWIPEDEVAYITFKETASSEETQYSVNDGTSDTFCDLRVTFYCLHDKYSSLQTSDMNYRFDKTVHTFQALPLTKYPSPAGLAFAGWYSKYVDSTMLNTTGNRIVEGSEMRGRVYARYLKTVDFNEALDNTALEFRTNGCSQADAPYGQSETFNSGSSAVRFGETLLGGKSCLATTLVGPGVLTYRWKQSCRYQSDYLSFGKTYAGSLATLQGESDSAWTTEMVDIPQGSGVYAWTYSRGTTGPAAGDNCAFLDKVVWMPQMTFYEDHEGAPPQAFTWEAGTPFANRLPTPSPYDGYKFIGWYAEGTDTPVTATDLVPTVATTYHAHWERVVELAEFFGAGAVGGDTGINWTGVPDAATLGDEVRDAIKSGAVNNGQSSDVTLNLLGSGTVSFLWKVASAATQDVLAFQVDGKLVESIPGTSKNYTRVTHEITQSGEHTLRWIYTKNASGSAGEDCGWITDFSWEPGSYEVVLKGKTITSGFMTFCGSVFSLPTFPIEDRANGTFVGWRDDKGKFYDKGMAVWDAAPKGGSVTFYEVWK